ncbi:MAG: mannitol dehydrogenase family protein [Bacillus sp. (in: Bacteria)]|nr:mannitol dehydrogenase family protein [Bacillus sp. (in: firmicutes)]MCM1426261.1 mannitol dehydrogenase family protein [Eubacterium sp.]
MKLDREGLLDSSAWEAAGYHVPKYDREKLVQNTKEKPQWIHFGAGNIFRAFQANLMQQLMETGKSDTGLIAAEGFDYEIIEKMYRPHDNYSILMTLKSNGEVEKTVIGSIVESLILDSENEKEFSRLKEIFAAPSLQMASFTITEKGYALTDGKGDVLPAIQRDFQNGPDKPESYLGKVCALVYERYLQGALPLALVSMDNCSHNGDKLKAAVTAFAKEWIEAGKAEKTFMDYVNDETKLSFPWSMIDKITPRPDPKVEAILEADKIEGLEKTVTSKNTWVAPFVNAEECQYLVIEDAFPNGRPALEEAGVMFTTRQTVDKVEKMKVCTCLNPLHTALAVFGCLLGYELISDEMKNPVLKKLVEKIGYQEGLPVVVNPGILEPKKFIDEVLGLRIPNPFMPDTPQRIATDTSQKLPIRFGETIKAYDAAKELSVDSLEGIPLVFAGWLRYLMGVDDKGNAFSPSPDPMLETLTPMLASVKLGEACDVKALITPILKRSDIFGVDLTQFTLGDKVIALFTEMIQGTGAVERTLENALL